MSEDMKAKLARIVGIAENLEPEEMIYAEAYAAGMKTMKQIYEGGREDGKIERKETDSPV